MIKFWYSKYELQPLVSLNSIAGRNARQGALLKMQWPDKKIGYADVFPWNEFGDEGIDRQLSLLSRGRLTKLMEQSIWLARSDALARHSGKNLMHEVSKIRNHFLITDHTKVTDKTLAEIRHAGFTTIKLKVGRDIREETVWIAKVLRENPFTIRLDYNTKGDFAAFEKMAQFFGPALRARIEYIEDPLPYDKISWGEISQFFNLAVDDEYDQVDWKGTLPFKVVILKPARRDIDKAVEKISKHNLKFSISSSMDHPIGVAHAVRVAAELKLKFASQILECGCCSNRIYKPSIFSLSMIFRGPNLLPIMGTGVGFDTLLMGMEWKMVNMK